MIEYKIIILNNNRENNNIKYIDIDNTISFFAINGLEYFNNEIFYKNKNNFKNFIFQLFHFLEL